MIHRYCFKANKTINRTTATECAVLNNDNSPLCVLSSKESPVRAVAAKPVLSNQSSVTSVDGGGMSLVRAQLACESWSTSDVQSWCSKVGVKGEGVWAVYAPDKRNISPRFFFNFSFTR